MNSRRKLPTRKKAPPNYFRPEENTPVEEGAKEKKEKVAKKRRNMQEHNQSVRRKKARTKETLDDIKRRTLYPDKSKQLVQTI